MSIDFRKATDCMESVQTNKLFGICDDQDGTKAYTDIDDTSKWIATVVNKNKIEIVFTAIDNCIIVHKKGSNDRESSCDGMLTFNDSIYLVELKKQRTGGWKTIAINQLKNTIRLLIENNCLEEFRYKKAYACNKRHPHFATVDNEFSKKFFKETGGFRIDIQAEILIK